MTYCRELRGLGRAGFVIATAATVAVFAVASAAAATPTVKSISPKMGSVGTKVTITGTGFAGVTSVTWVIFSSNPPKYYAAKFTKTATSIVATAPVAWPGKKYAGYIEAKTGTKELMVSCWGAC